MKSIAILSSGQAQSVNPPLNQILSILWTANYLSAAQEARDRLPSSPGEANPPRLENPLVAPSGK